jgi:hypothetical protein
MLPFLDPKSNNFKVDSIVLTLTLLLRYQSHYWAHSKSCFKKSTRMSSMIMCHFVSPPLTTLMIVVNVKFKIIITQCQIDNEYINGYS